MASDASTQRPLRVVVTGAASGIGLAVAERILTDGGRVAALDIVPEAPAGLDAPYVAVDVRDADAVRAAVDGAARQLGGLDAVACCAAIAIRGTVETASLDDWRDQFDVNVLGTVTVVRAAIPHLRGAGGGAIVTIGSNLGVVAQPNLSAYCATKGAILSLTQSMAIDLTADGIRVNSVSPGPTRTPMLTNTLATSTDPETATRDAVATQLHGRLVEPEEVAAAVVWLLGSGNRSILGANLAVDGGYTVR
ncbi:MAG: 2-keto-3-deoxy-L-fuconate dehydrogenase [Solirubrobacteraceae bacterium]|jgi:NAD(P)-dependent dehydrogenase (short-subunit alcohol dehydrogenase family)|nr:2-keto-3-deoxy-L-fuconate dehydrogenase [Solirubrobacteraceae bacterium]